MMQIFVVRTRFLICLHKQPATFLTNLKQEKINYIPRNFKKSLNQSCDESSAGFCYHLVITVIHVISENKYVSIFLRQFFFL
jgi:hypothetical protein